MLTATMAHAEQPSATTAAAVSSLSEERTQQEQVQQHPAVSQLAAVGRKTVYFTVGQRKEVAIFEDRTPSEEIKSKTTRAPNALCTAEIF